MAVPQDYILAHSFTPVTRNPWPANRLWCTSVLPAVSKSVQTYLTYMSPPQNVGGLSSNFVYSAHMVTFCKQLFKWLQDLCMLQGQMDVANFTARETRKI